jgi:hypothetical protein
MSQKLSGGRRIFSEPQAAQYFYTDRLAKMTGRTSGDWHRVVVKELMDNALDAAESAGRVPVIEVAMDVDPSLIRLSVQDNGVGIPADVIERMLDFSVFASDKAVYRTPTRGQQGNALKTIVGMPQAMGLVDCPPQLSIDALSVQHRIKAQLDGAGHPDIDLQQDPSKHPGPGSTVEVLLPTNSRAWMKGTAMLRVDVRDLLRGYHLFNPHALVTFSAFALGIDHGNFGGTPEEKITETHLPTNTEYRKFMPDDPLVVHWFDVQSFTRLIRGYVREGEDLPLGQFIKKFRGFSSRAKAAAARESVPDARKLSDLSDGDAVGLFIAMKGAVKEPSHKVLGDPLGEEHMVGTLRKIYGASEDKRSWYSKPIKTTLNGAPAVVEAAVLEVENELEVLEGDKGDGFRLRSKGGALFVGLNHSHTYEDPLVDVNIMHPSDKVPASGWGIRGFLRDAKVFGQLEQKHVAAVHITAAAPATTDFGKTTLSLDGDDLAEALATALWKVSKDIHKEARARERDAARAERDAERRVRQQLKPSLNKAEACYAVMWEAYIYSTGNEALPTMARDLYYAVRNRIERFGYDADELAYGYFANTVLPDYRREVQELPLVEYEPRGTLYEPHDGKEVHLGTRSVAEYNFPNYLFNKILYIEKKGRVGILQAAGVDKRHDMALIGGQGYATEAVRKLFESAEKGDYQLFVLHDADRNGYGIARTLREETRRMPGYSVEVIDIGLKLEDALAMGKRPETQRVDSRLDAKVEVELTDLEREYFVGEERKVMKNGKEKTQWVVKRIELNDLSSPQLVEYVEDKLKENDARGKVIPPEEEMAPLAEGLYREKLRTWVEDVIDAMLKTDDLKAKMAQEFQERYKLQGAQAWIKTEFEHRDDSKGWREAVKDTLDAAYTTKHRAALRDAVREYITETVAAENEEE